jgi:hypothetical protein
LLARISYVIWQVYDDMRSNGVLPDTTVFTALLMTCVHAKSVELAKETVALMDKVLHST